ncbi:MAG: fucose pyrophosphorylase domain-containing protein, partial [Verrucomicrobiales bacterium]
MPPGLVADFETLEGLQRPEWFATSDPADRKLGSGGGTAHVLVEGWKATGQGQTFQEWLRQSPKLMVHAGGQSRRLPAYAPVGKLFMPIPVFRWALGQRLDQTLLEIQLPDYQRVLRHAGENFATMVASGDVLLRFGRELPPFPQVDVLGLGMWVTPEIARNFGVYFCHRRDPSNLAFFLQKPAPARIRELSPDYFYLIDTGMWLLSPRAVEVLLRKCGWDSDQERFESNMVKFFELYSEFGLGLGSSPFKGDAEISTLTSAVVPLPEAEFYHLGASRQMIEAVSALQHLELDETKLGLMGAKRHPDQYLQDSNFGYPLRLEENHTLWVENSSVNASWKLEHDHVLTGIPPNEWDLKLESGVCLDFVPVGEDAWCIRAYGIDDTFSGQVGETATKWFGRPAPNWFFGRGISREEAQITPSQDIQTARIFPVVKTAELNPRFIEWLFQSRPENQPEFAKAWMQCERLSAQEIQARANLIRLYTQRQANRKLCLAPM